jgi:tRNA threonylcarbamoyladenosine biosynthesis protein TsaB
MFPMNLLAIDTCTEMCSAAVRVGGRVFSRAVPTQRGHSDLILNMIDEVLLESEATLSDIDALVFGRGPGGFTGVRVGVGVAQGIAFAKSLPVIPISTLAATAQVAIDQYQAENVIVALDARMGEIYTAQYQANSGLAKAISEETVCPPEALSVSGSDIFAAGTGWSQYEILQAKYSAYIKHQDGTLLPTAEAMLKLALPMAEAGETMAAHAAVPVYLRDNVAKKKGEQ